MHIERLCYPNPWPEVLFRGHLGEDGFLVCELDERVIAYIIIGLKIPTLFQRLEKRTRALAGQQIDMNEQTGHLMNIAVDPAHRGKGIATTLIERGINYLKSLEADSVELEVRRTNVAAIRLYENLGFKIVRSARKYYQDGEDALIMSKKL